MKLNCLLSNIKNQVLSVQASKILTSEQDILRTIKPAHRYLNQNKSIANQVNNFSNTEINGLSLNSKTVKDKFLFFCLSGAHHKGSDFINEAYQNGARVVITEDRINADLPKDLVVIRVKDIFRCLDSVVNKFYNYPLDKLNLTAVTGTNGKTTTTFIIENILKSFQKNVGVMGTVNYRFKDKVFSAINTTPDILTTYSLINQMLNAKIQYLVMEISSHALIQRRIEGLKFDQAVFTNLSQDHFDYHKTKRNYFIAKSILFRQYLKKDGTAIINIDDDYGLKILDLIKKDRKYRILTYGIKRKADILADNILFKPDGCCFTVCGLKHRFKVETDLLGSFNIYNALAAISACLIMRIPKDYIINGIKDIYLPGRLERIHCNQDIKIFVDYAHTEEALRNILLSLGKLKGRGRLIVVFGCGGDRDKDKRPKMGKVASELADFVIITSDNPRFENPEKIISQIKKGIKKTNYITLPDRKAAIKKAIDISRIGDIIVVAGKGHEGYQIVKDKKIAFNDRIVTEEILAKKDLLDV